MNLSFSPTPEYTFIVLPSDSGATYVNEFRVRYIAENQLFDVENVDHRVFPYFQSTCINTYIEDILESDGDTECILKSKDWDILGVYYVYKEFIERYPNANVLSLIPLDLKGTFGFVVTNDM